ncbi:MAG: hypothetical protein KC492_44395, partial [Myxococcales bacterium]|nr:hypothetical protein [Myxococcales bacterium]
MLLTGLGSTLLPMSEKLMTRVLEDKFPRTLQVSSGAAAPAQEAKPEGGKAPIQVWTELLVECWLA